VADACVDCRTLRFTSGYTEVFESRAFDGSPVLVTLRMCLECGSRFADRREMRGYLLKKLPAHAVAAAAPAAAR
jgi:transcriptional regulator NrdR family protein